MSYTALYRKFRPQEFEDVKGQEHIVTTLKNQIKADRMGHAYLFCGTRGTGKTTVAKIFAKAVNCEAPIDGSPCGNCAICKAIADGSSMNVIEIDAASNNGVDNIRQIRDEVSYRPTEGKYKVYIIDEVHMLSPGAFNALLKTLEEPPAYVKFILATTEAHKIPITILSRCQRYDFHRISIDTITERLADLMKEEQIDVEERALRYVAKVGDGSMRDALSLLDQCIAFHLGEKLTYDNVLDVLGAVDTEVFSRLLRQIIAGNIKEAICTVDWLVDEGRELGQMVTDFTWYLRNLLLLQSSSDMEDVLDMSAEHLASLKEEAALISPEVLIRYIRIFSELSNQIKYATQKRIWIEIAIIKLCKPQMETDTSALLNRMDILEDRLESGAFVVPQGTGGVQQPVAEVEKTVLPEALPEDIQMVVNRWQAILSGLGGVVKQYLSDKNSVIPTLGANGELLLVFENETAYGYIQQNMAGSYDNICRVIEENTHKQVEVKLQLHEGPQRAKDQYPRILEFVKNGINLDGITEEIYEDSEEIRRNN